MPLKSPRRTARLLLLYGLLSHGTAWATGLALPKAATQCTRSATLMQCHDLMGNYYSMALMGRTVFLRGHDAVRGLSWAQTSSSTGQGQVFCGFSSDGQVWIGRTRKIGWNVLGRFSSSTGTRGQTSCNRLKGCSY